MGIDPVTLGIASLALGAVGTITQAAGAAQTAEANRAQATYQAQVAENNQIIANQNAMQARAAGAQEAAIQGQKTKAEVGGIKAAQAASNIDVNSGSALDVRSSASQLGELNSLTIRSNAARQAYGYETQGLAYQGEAALDQSRAASAVAAGNTAIAGSLLGGAGSLSRDAFKYQQAGVLFT